jgi:hypothetical protein
VDVLLADSPQQLADAIVLGKQDEPLWQQLWVASLATLERNFSFTVATDQLRVIPVGWSLSIVGKELRLP